MKGGAAPAPFRCVMDCCAAVCGCGHQASREQCRQRSTTALTTAQIASQISAPGDHCRRERPAAAAAHNPAATRDSDHRPQGGAAATPRQGAAEGLAAVVEL